MSYAGTCFHANVVFQANLFFLFFASDNGYPFLLQDAHNAILDYDDDSSLFAVYDGHGGHEVAVYTAKRLPKFIKTRHEYRTGNIKQALVDSFVEFDRGLTERDVVRELRVIAGKEAEAEDDMDPEEVDNLYQEATMTIDEVMAKTVAEKVASDADTDEAATATSKTEVTESGSSSSAAPSSTAKVGLSTAVTNFKARNGSGSSKPISPFLRGRPSKSGETPVLAPKIESFKEEGEEASPTKNGAAVKPEQDHKNGDAESKDVKTNGSSNGEAVKSEKEDDKDTPTTNGQHDDSEVIINGQAAIDREAAENEKNSQKAAEAVVADIKGKGKGKGKGKSSQIVRTKTSEDDDHDDLVPMEPSPPKEKKPVKSAEELYHNLVGSEEMEEEESDEEDFGEVDDSDDDDDLDEEEEEDEEDSDEDDTGDDADEDDSEIIGGEFNEEVRQADFTTFFELSVNYFYIVFSPEMTAAARPSSLSWSVASCSLPMLAIRDAS